MRTFFDTSVLIAALVEGQPQHSACNAELAGCRDGCVYTHCLGECFALLTGGRMTPVLSGNDAALLLRESVVSRLSQITLTPEEYLHTLESAQAVSARGGAIYDMLILAAARKAKARRILTLNKRHFETFAPDLRDYIITPH